MRSFSSQLTLDLQLGSCISAKETCLSSFLWAEFPPVPKSYPSPGLELRSRVGAGCSVPPFPRPCLRGGVPCRLLSMCYVRAMGWASCCCFSVPRMVCPPLFFQSWGGSQGSVRRGEAALLGPLPESSCPSISCCRRSLAPLQPTKLPVPGPGHEHLFHSRQQLLQRLRQLSGIPGPWMESEPEPESEPKAGTEAWRGGGRGWPKNEWRAREAGPRNYYK